MDLVYLLMVHHKQFMHFDGLPRQKTLFGAISCWVFLFPTNTTFLDSVQTSTPIQLLAQSSEAEQSSSDSGPTTVLKIMHLLSSPAVHGIDRVIRVWLMALFVYCTDCREHSGQRKGTRKGQKWH